METQNTQNKPTPKIEWTEMKGKIKSRFSKLSDENIDSVKDNVELLSGKLQSTYGYSKEQADKEFQSFKTTLQSPSEPHLKTASSNSNESENSPKAKDSKVA